MPFDDVADWLNQQDNGPKPFSRDPKTGDPLYLPEGWGGPSADDFARADTRKRQDTADAAPMENLRGTMFDQDPTEAWLRRQALTSKPEDSPDEFLPDGVKPADARAAMKRSSRFSDIASRVAKPFTAAWDALNSTPEFIRKKAEQNVKILQRGYDEGDPVSAFLQGVQEPAAAAATPFNLITTALGFSELKGLSPAMKALRALKTGGETVMAGQSIGEAIPEAYEGVQERDPWKVGKSVFDAAMGTVMARGAHAGAVDPATRAAAEAAADADGRAATRTRTEQFNADNNTNLGEFNRYRNDPEAWIEQKRAARDMGRNLQDPPMARREMAGPMATTGGPDPVEQFLLEQGAAPGAAPDPNEPIDGDVIQHAITGRPPMPQIAPGSVERFLADHNGNVRDLSTTPDAARALPPGRGDPLVTPPPREGFRGSALQASMAPQTLNDGELRMAYIDAATAGDTNSLNRLEAELQRRKAPAGPTPTPEPTPFYDPEGRFTLNPDDMSLPDEMQAPSPEVASTSLAHMLAPPSADQSAMPGTSAPRTVEATPDNVAAAAKTGDVVDFTPQTVGQIALDPKTYQFKTSDARGRTSALEGVQQWDPWSPPIVLHRTPEGKLFVADGHQRFNKYLELAQKGEPMPPLKARIVEGPTSSIVRAASLRNVQEGSADPLDIARLVRNGGDLTPGERARVGNLSSTKLRQGQDLGRLGDDAFNQVLAGVAPPDHAAYVGRYITDPAQQALVVQQLGAAGLENQTQAEAFVKAMRDAGFETQEQTDLFGNSIQAVSLAKPKAQIVDSVIKGLRDQKRAFAGALANAKRLEAAGNVLAGTENARLADEAGKLRAYFEALYDKPGTATNAAIRDAAVAVHNRATSPAGAAGAVIDALRADLEGGNFGASAASAAAGGPGGSLADGRVATRPVPEPQGSLLGEQAPPVALAKEQGKVANEQPASALPGLEPPKKARQLLEEHLGKDNKVAVREVMDRIVADHPKDVDAQRAAAQDWIAKNPEPVKAAAPAAAASTVPWEPHETGGEHRTVEGTTGAYHEIRYAERPAASVREGLMDAGYKYDFRDKTWRKQETPSSASPSSAATPGQPALAKPPADAATPATEPVSVRKPRERLARGVPRGTRTPRLSAAPEAKALPAGTQPELGKFLESGDAKAGEAWADKAAKKAEGGTHVAEGFAGLHELFQKHPDLAWMLTRMAVGGIVGSRWDKDDPWMGFIGGAAAGVGLNRKFLNTITRLGVRAAGEIKATPWTAVKEATRQSLPKLRADPPPKTRDFTMLDYLRRPEGAVPDHAERIRNAYSHIEGFLGGDQLPGATRDLHGNLSDDPFQALRDIDPNSPKARTLAAGVFYQDALSQLRKDIVASREAGLKRRARYLTMLENAVTEEPINLYKTIGNIFGVSGHKIQRVDNVVTNHAYRILLGGAVDTAINNRTQVGYNLKNVPLRYVAEGIRQAHTPEGKQATEFAKLHRPLDVEQAQQAGGPLAKVDEFLNLMEPSDTQNRRESYLAARQYALDKGASAADADKWAQASMRQTQSDPGPAGKHPMARELGPMRMFTNFPHLVAELVADTFALRKENPEGFRRMAAYLLGGGLLGSAVGINTWNMLFPRFSVSLTAGKAVLDLGHHALAEVQKLPGVPNMVAPPDHSIKEDILGGDGKNSLVVPRYPQRVYETAKHFLGHGVDPKTGEFIERDPRGRERSRHTPFQSILSLLGVDTTSEGAERAKNEKAFEFATEKKAESALHRRTVQRDLADAIDSGDHERIAELMQGLNRRERRDMRRAVGASKWSRLRAQVPKANRREFDEMFVGQ